MIERKNVFPAMIIVFVTVCIAQLANMFLPYDQNINTAANANQNGSGTIQVCVVDGWSEAPIKGATVVIPELNKSFKTDDFGKTAVLTVPIIKDEVYKDILDKTWGEITLIIYSDGYIPYALFNVMVTADQYRNGPTILLFKEGSTSSSAPFCIVEGPDTNWANELIKKFKP